MSDQRIRELERRWRETGSDDDEAAYLAERMRLGELTRKRVLVCALLGSKACRIVMSDYQETRDFTDPSGSRADDLTGLRRLKGGELQRGLQLLTCAVLAQRKRKRADTDPLLPQGVGQVSYRDRALNDAWWAARSPSETSRRALWGPLHDVTRVLSRTRRQRASLELSREILDGTWRQRGQDALRGYRPRDLDEWRRRLMDQVLTVPMVDFGLDALSRAIEEGGIELVTIDSVVPSHVSDAMICALEAHAHIQLPTQVVEGVVMTAGQQDLNNDVITTKALQEGQMFSARKTSDQEDDAD